MGNYSPKEQAIVERMFHDLDRLKEQYGEGPLFFARMAMGLAELDGLKGGDCVRVASEMLVNPPNWKTK